MLLLLLEEWLAGLRMLRAMLLLLSDLSKIQATREFWIGLNQMMGAGDSRCTWCNDLLDAEWLTLLQHSRHAIVLDDHRWMG